MTNTKKKEVKAWAVTMDDGFIPDFNVNGKMDNVYQIHSTHKGAKKFADACQKASGWHERIWFAVPCTITYSLLKVAKKVTKKNC